MTFIVDEYGYKVRRLGGGWYQMECDGATCAAPSTRTRDWQEARRWGSVHRQRHHRETGNPTLPMEVS